jgi:mycothiol synthase
LVEFRRFEEEDADACADLTLAVAAADGIPAFSEYKAVDIESRSGHTVVAAHKGAVVAVGHAAWHHGDRVAAPHWAIEAAVHPSVRRSGVWADVVRQTVATVPPNDRHVVWGWNAAFELIARDLGYRPVRRLSVMERTLPPERHPAFTADIELTPFVPGRDELAWLQTNNAAFVGHLENGGLTEDDLSERMALPWFRPEDVLMAWSGTRLAGSCWTKRHPDAVGEIYVIGVHPDFQGGGLGRELVIAGLHHLATEAGARTGMLYVDQSAVGAMRLYAELGFQQVWVTTMYAPGDTGGTQD